MTSSVDRRLVRYWAIFVAVQSVIALLGVVFSKSLGFHSIWAFTDVLTYKDYSSAIGQRLVPYRDFLVEYPPLAIPFFVVPKLFPGNSLESFKFGFLLEMLAVNAVAVWVVAAEVARSEGIGRVPSRLAWYTAFFAVLCPMDVTRFDLVPMLAAFAAVAWFGRGRMTGGGVIVGLGVLAKLIPGLVIVPMLCSLAPWKSKARAAIAAGLIVGFGVLGWWWVGGPQIAASLRYHSERGLEIGSTYASAYMVASEVARVPIHWAFDHSSANVVGPGSMMVAKASILIQLACLGFVAWRSRRAGPGDLFRLSGAAILAYVVGGKVLSPQYMIWLMPFVVASGSGLRLFLACCLLTTAIFPWSFDDLSDFHLYAEVLLIARNLGLLWLFAILSRPVRPTGD